MANIFLDANIIFDILIRNNKKATMVFGHIPFISPLSYHILYYSQNIKVPHKTTIDPLKKMGIVNFTKKILEQALVSPTNDLEDNIQLHSASKANCGFFLTDDKKLLKMKSFGKMKIVDKIT